MILEYKYNNMFF